jgi:hypothetical protein
MKKFFELCQSMMWPPATTSCGSTSRMRRSPCCAGCPRLSAPDISIDADRHLDCVEKGCMVVFVCPAAAIAPIHCAGRGQGSMRVYRRGMGSCSASLRKRPIYSTR